MSSFDPTTGSLIPRRPRAAQDDGLGDPAPPGAAGPLIARRGAEARDDDAAAAGAPGGVPPADPPVVLPTTLAEVAAAVRDRILAAGLALNPAVVFARKLQPYPASGDPQVVVSRGGFREVGDQHSGGGRFTATYAGEVRVGVNARSVADELGQDGIRLLGDLAPPVGLTGTVGSSATPGLTLANTPDDFAADGPSARVIVGLEAMAHQVLDALLLEFLADAAGNHLTVEPVRLVGNAEPVEYPGFPGWEGIVLVLRVVYLARLTPPGA